MELATRLDFGLAPVDLSVKALGPYGRCRSTEQYHAVVHSRAVSQHAQQHRAKPKTQSHVSGGPPDATPLPRHRQHFNWPDRNCSPTTRTDIPAPPQQAPHTSIPLLRGRARVGDNARPLTGLPSWYIGWTSLRDEFQVTLAGSSGAESLYSALGWRGYLQKSSDSRIPHLQYHSVLCGFSITELD